MSARVAFSPRCARETLRELLVDNVVLLSRFMRQARWNHHNGAINRKANDINPFIHWDSTVCQPLIREMSYKALVRPIITACVLSYGTHLLREMVQRRAGRAVVRDFRTTRSIKIMET